MAEHGTTQLASLTFAVVIMLAGCATLRQSQAHETEQLLAAAGFTMQLADTAAQQHLHASVPAGSRAKDGAVEYAYADPNNCQCVYVGGSTEYSAVQRLSAERRQIVRERLSTADDSWADW